MEVKIEDSDIVPTATYHMRAVDSDQGLYGIVNMSAKQEDSNRVHSFVWNICAFFQKSEGRIFVDPNIFFYGRREALQGLYRGDVSEKFNLGDFEDDEARSTNPDGGKTDKIYFIPLDRLRGSQDLQRKQKDLISYLIKGAAVWLEKLSYKHRILSQSDARSFVTFVKGDLAFPIQLLEEVRSRDSRYYKGYDHDLSLGKLLRSVSDLGTPSEEIFQFPEWTNKYGGIS